MSPPTLTVTLILVSTARLTLPYYGSTLNAAARKGPHKHCAAPFLLENGAPTILLGDGTAVSRCNQPLHDQAFLHAASYSWHEVLQVLLQQRQVSADLLRKASHETALGEHQATVKWLLAEFGVDANAEGNE
jgi:hypothetical protein